MNSISPAYFQERADDVSLATIALTPVSGEVVSGFMKVTATIFFTLFTLAMADQEPQDLQKLRESFDEAQKKEFRKLNDVYLKQLEKLKNQFLSRKDLESAVACDAAIKKAKAAGPKLTGSPLDGAWILKDGDIRKLYSIKGGHLMTHTLDKGVIKTQADGFTVTFGTWVYKFKARLDNPNLYDGVDSHGKRFQIERLW
ncbi:hypothetical protein OAL62_01330 [bacterium]|nr:hypothetical protein [bacterium]